MSSSSNAFKADEIVQLIKELLSDPTMPIETSWTCILQINDNQKSGVGPQSKVQQKCVNLPIKNLQQMQLLFM